jgi:catalase
MSVGRPRLCPDAVLLRAVELRCSGRSYRQIATMLNSAGLPTPSGGARWYGSHVFRLLHTRGGSQLLQSTFPPDVGQAG